MKSQAFSGGSAPRWEARMPTIVKRTQRLDKTKTFYAKSGWMFVDDELEPGDEAAMRGMEVNPGDLLRIRHATTQEFVWAFCKEMSRQGVVKARTTELMDTRVYSPGRSLVFGYDKIHCVGTIVTKRRPTWANRNEESVLPSPPSPPVCDEGECGEGV